MTPRRVLLSGASGLIGRGLSALFASSGCEVTRLVRRQAGPGPGREVPWDPAAGALDPAVLDGQDAVVHLSGESLSAGRFTEARKREIRASRVRSTLLLAERLAVCTRGPRVLICASAIGFYGDRGEAPVDEGSAPGSGFLAEVCQAWEAAADPARAAGLRVCHVRLGVVLSAEGGALAKMLTPFRLGLGGRVGDGRQVMSWIDLADALGLFLHCLKTESLRGPVNATAPNAVSNAEFTQTLASVLGRPALLPLPALAVRAVFGEMGEALLLSGARVRPTRALESGYGFRYPMLEESLRHQLQSPRPVAPQPPAAG